MNRHATIVAEAKLSGKTCNVAFRQYSENIFDRGSVGTFPAKRQAQLRVLVSTDLTPICQWGTIKTVAVGLSCNAARVAFSPRFINPPLQHAQALRCATVEATLIS